MATTSFESKFGILADSVLGDQLPSTRKSALGFQVVASEDDNERALGVMAYRIGNRLVYVPVFWLGGKVKGGDIMYLKEEDLFRPFTEVWVNYIATGKDFKTGELAGRDRSRGGAYRVSTMDLNWLHSKRAGDVGLVDVASLEGMARMAGAEDSEISLVRNLSLFTAKAAADLAAALVDKPRLANAMFAHYTPNEVGRLLGNRMKVAIPAEKRAAAPAVEIISDREDARAAGLDVEEKLELARRGVLVRDTRKEASEAFVVNRDAVMRWSQPTVSGNYDMLEGSFDTRKIDVLLNVQNLPDKDDLSMSLEERRRENAPGCYILSDGGKLTEVKQGELPMVKSDNDPRPVKAGEKVTAEALRKMLPPKGNDDSQENRWKGSVIIYDNKQAFRGRLAAGHAGAISFGPRWGESNFKRIILTGRPGSIQEADNWYIPEGARVIHLHRYKEVPLDAAPVRVPDSTMISAGYVPVKVAGDNGRWEIASRAHICAGASFPRAVEELVTVYDLRAKQAMDILDDGARLKEGLVFYVKAGGEEEYARGDDRTLTKEVAGSAAKGISDESVARIAKASEKGVKEVLDIAVLKEMADSGYPLARVSDSLPVMTRALDRLCRNLFYFYWHNEDFEDRFGSQSLDQLEESLKENIQSLGDLVMYLQEKSVMAESDLAGGDQEGDLTDTLS